jgi:hypothetical protein
MKMRLSSEEALAKLPKNLSKRGIDKEDQPNFDWIDLPKLHSIVQFVKTRLEKRQSIMTKRSSYNLKRAVERLIGFYVENGYLIAAMIIAGYNYKVEEGSMNTYHNVSFRSIDKLWNEINNVKR